jgi:hypothetical protein
MADDVIYRASLNDDEVLESLRSIDKGIDKLVDEADDNFYRLQNALDDTFKAVGAETIDELRKIGQQLDKLGQKDPFDKPRKSAAETGITIGIVSGITQELTRRFIELGERAAEAFAKAVVGGIKLNQEAEDIRVSLTAIFGGNQDAADAFLATIDEVAKKLGANRQELRAFAKSILPDVGNIDTVAKLTEQAKLLSADAGVSVESARIAFEEALSGNLTSLQRRLNIGAKYIDQIRKEAAETGDLAGAIANVLGDKIEKSGLSIENFADNLSIALSKVQAIATDLQQLLGEAGFNEAKEQINAILSAFDKNKDSIERVAQAFGEVAAKVIEIVGSNIADFLENGDFEAFETLAENMADTLDAAELLVEVLNDPNIFGGAIEQSNNLLDVLKQALVTASQIGALAKAEAARKKAEADALNVNIDEATLAGLSGGDPIRKALIERGLAEGAKLAASPEDKLKAEQAGQEAYNKVILEAAEALNQYNDRLDENKQKHDERRQSQEKDTAAGTAAGEAYLEQQQRAEELANAESDAAEARKTIEEKLTEAKKDAVRDFVESAIKYQRQILDDEIKNAQKREDIARKNAEKIADIFRKNEQRIADAATDLSRDEADAIRDASRQTEDVEADSANRRLDIERNYRQGLQRIQAQFNQSAADAERNNDAQAFIAAIRTRDAQIDEAKRGRENDIESAKIDASRRRDELKTSLDREIEDAQLANARKLEDLQTALEREIEEQRIANEREYEEQTIAEQRQAEARRLAQAQELADLARHQAQKLADLQASLQAEYETVVEYEKKKADAIIQSAIDIQNKIRSLTGAGRSSGTPTRTAGPTGSTAPSGASRQSRANGGPVYAGQTYLVGERGPEPFTPAVNGYISPAGNFGGYGSGVVNNIDNSRSIGQVNAGGEFATDAIMQRMIQNAVRQAILEYS